MKCIFDQRSAQTILSGSVYAKKKRFTPNELYTNMDMLRPFIGPGPDFKQNIFVCFCHLIENTFHSSYGLSVFSIVLYTVTDCKESKKKLTIALSVCRPFVILLLSYLVYCLHLAAPYVSLQELNAQINNFFPTQICESNKCPKLSAVIIT